MSMLRRFVLWLNRSYPQNYLIKNPYRGALVTAIFSFIFLVLYTPLNINPNHSKGFEGSMAIYSFSIVFPQIAIILILRKISFFSSTKEWNMLKEIIAVTVVLFGMGIFVYFMGFWLEGPKGRWNFSTFFDSIKITVLVGFIFFGFFSALNYRHRTTSHFHEENKPEKTEPEESKIQINSRLKNEELSFFPSQFLFAASDSNYVIFYLMLDGIIQKEMIRNSITDIEKQLCGIPGIFKTHRSFIVNLNKVRAKKGNALGYKLELEGIEEEIPVARNKAQSFNEQFNLIQ